MRNTVVVLALSVLFAGSNTVTAQRFSGDGKWFQYNYQALYNVETGQRVVWEKARPQQVRPDAFGRARTPLHATVSINYDGSMVVWARGYGAVPLSKRVTYSVKGKQSRTDVGAPYDYSFSPDGKWMAMREARGTIFYDITNAPNFVPVETSYNQKCQPVFTNDSRYCVCGGYVRKDKAGGRSMDLDVRNLRDKFKQVDSLPTDFEGSFTLAFNPDCSLLLAWNQGRAKVLTLDESGKLKQKVSVVFRDKKFSPEHVALATNEGKLGLLVRAYHLDVLAGRSLLFLPFTDSNKLGEAVPIVPVEKYDSSSVAVSRDGKRALYGRRYWVKEKSELRPVGAPPLEWKWKLVKLGDGKPEIVDINIVGGPVFHPDGKRFVAREPALEKPKPGESLEGPLALFDAEDGTVIRRFDELVR